MPQHRPRPDTQPEDEAEDIQEDSASPPPPATQQPQPKPLDKPVAIDPDDASLEEPKDDAFQASKGNRRKG